MLARTLIAVGFIAAIVLLLFLNLTTPAAAGPLGILAVFACIYLILLVGLTFLSWGLHRLITRILRPFVVRRPIQPLSLVRTYYVSSVLALGPVMLLGMQSVGAIGVYEFFLVVVFMLLAGVYAAKITS